MTHVPLYPLRFEPIYQYRVWGGGRLENILDMPLPEGPIGEAWILSDRNDHPSVVANGELKGLSLSQLMLMWPAALLGDAAGLYTRFPLLLKFLDARERLSVQVHPSDAQTRYIPRGEHGKTEAWVVLEADPKSMIRAGLVPGTTPEALKQAAEDGTVEHLLSGFVPKIGDGVFIPAGAVHTLGEGVVVFEVQENSDVTFRLFDWDQVDPKTGKRRALQVEQAIACVDYSKGPVTPVLPVVETETPCLRERLFDCEHFGLWRLSGSSPFMVGAMNKARVLVCVAGGGQIKHEIADYPVRKGDVTLLPAAVGSCFIEPTESVTVLEISLPEGAFR